MNTTKEGHHPAHSIIEIRGADARDFTPAIEEFRKNRGIHFILAFSGGADDDSPLLRHFAAKIEGATTPDELRGPLKNLLKTSKEEYVADIVRSILKPLRGFRIAVQTGGTSWGVPEIATKIAREFGFPTIGVFPLTAQVKGNTLAADQLDLGICVHPFINESQWGDEAPFFTKLLDTAIVIGGGAGTMVEVAHVLKLNERKGVAIKHLIPIYGTGGTADKLSFFPGKPSTMAACVPAHPITSGEGAYRYLIDNILPSEIYDRDGQEQE